MKEETRKAAMNAAIWVTASPHEWVWTHEQQIAMAQFCCWANPIVSDLEKLVGYACTVQQNSRLGGPKYVVVDVDGMLVCEASTIEDVMSLAIDTIEGRSPPIASDDKLLLSSGWELVMTQEEGCESWTYPHNARTQWPAWAQKEFGTQHYWDRAEAAALQRRIESHDMPSKRLTLNGLIDRGVLNPRDFREE